jgi:hypothetical protein
MSLESIANKRWMKKSNNTATKGMPRNRHRSERINSGSRNEGGSLDGSADALQLHTVTRKYYRVDSMGLVVFNVSWNLAIGGC